MAVAWCINAYDCSWNLIRTLEQLQSSNIGVWVQYTAPNPLDDKKIDYIKYTDKCGCTCTLSWENEILIYATNGVIKNLTLTNDDVNEAIKIKWNDIFGSNRAKTIVRYKTWSYPVSITDGTLAVEETTKNQYSSTPFSLSGVLDETTYYISAFAVDSNGTIIDVQGMSITTSFEWKPDANTIWYYKLEWNVNDYSWNNRNLTNSWITFTTSWSLTVAKLSSWSNAYYQNNTLFNKSYPFTYSAYINADSIPSWYYDTKEINTNLIVWIQNWTDLWTHDKDLCVWLSNKAIWYNYPWEAKYVSWWTISTWTRYNLTLTYDWSNMKLYVNATLVWTVACAYSYTWYTNARLTIWKSWTTRWSSWFKWKISKVVVENKARTQTEIQNFVNKTKSKYWIS